MNSRRIALAAWAFAAVVGIGLAGGNAAGLRLNLTDSAPTGLWRVEPVTPDRLERGALVSVCPPPLSLVEAVRVRGFLHVGDCPVTKTTPLLKAVVAVPGDTVTVAPAAPLQVNGTVIPGTAPQAGMPAWPSGTYHVQHGELWVASGYNRGSFDSRYFGPVPIKNVRGIAFPVLVKGNVTAIADATPRGE